MVFLNKNVLRLLPIVRHQIVKCFNTKSDLYHFNFQPKFTQHEQDKILQILNESNQDSLQSFNISKKKIKNLENYKYKKGPFRSLNQVLEVDGLGVKILEKLCDQILSKPADEIESVSSKTNNVPKRVKKFLAPPLPPTLNLTSAIGIHVAPIGVSWAKLNVQKNELLDWGYEDLVTVPKKILPTETFDLAVKIARKLPVGDVYVFEGASSMGLHGQKPSIAAFTQQFELISMLLAIINTSPVHNAKSQNLSVENEINKVYFVRQKLPARLFKTLVGNECVSGMNIISELLDNREDFSLSCSRVLVDQVLKSEYGVQSAPYKELLGQALMLTIAFTDLCWKRNPASLIAVAPQRR